eukprot:CAMPEP_0175864864 /NCGR_PEP_ID=MMETSP0107_2-20121207/33329_1 /TAXON_ID=195067 ORGANISM="Goniomonas pacifica, Strain CCMP1869" /NCGR_SAMPLE_ID=MMETSP0107_2 /ASSEMBLY_ACC=CAM_ASM_000203 /LENGTH=32 /DNA_ID= /DNA_START= /DNA_END= /DNA_ORIENTATION=
MNEKLALYPGRDAKYPVFKAISSEPDAWPASS